MRLSLSTGTPLAALLLGLTLAALPGATARPAAAQNGSVPFVHKHIYPDVSAAQPDIAAALVQARKEHKRVLVDFGGDWCGDCQVLDIYFHDATNLPLLEKNYVLVHVNIGHIDQNLELGDKYGVTLRKGVPALAVLSPDGKAIYGQRNGEFESMRHMESSAVTAFLTQWKPK